MSVITNMLKSSQPKLVVSGEEGNTILLSSDVAARGKISFKRGIGNTISVGEGATIVATIVIHGDRNVIRIGAGCSIKGNITIKGSGQEVTIGDNTTFGDVYILAQEGCNVMVGKNCMFSRRIEVRTTDAHSVIDVASGRRLNSAKPISIGDHVWVGLGCVIGKGAVIPDDCIVGTMSFVNKAFTESQVVLAGAPAKIVKRGVTWNRSRKVRFSAEEMSEWR